MAWAPNHAFADQLISRRSKGRDLALQLLGNVTGAMRPCPQFRHRPQVAFFQRGQTVEANAEEAFIECCDGGCRCQIDVFQSDG